MAGEYELGQLILELSRDLCKNEKFRDYANAIGPKIANYATTLTTGSREAGLGADVIGTALAKIDPDKTAQVVAVALIAPVAIAASFVAAPIVAGVVAYESLKSIGEWVSS